MSAPSKLWREVPGVIEAMVAEQGERALGGFFRRHPRLGRRDRGLVADAAYGCLRRRRSLDYALGNTGDNGPPEPDPARTAAGLAAWLCLFADWDAEQAAAAIDPTLLPTLNALRDPRTADPATRAELPDWLYADLSAQLPAAEVQVLGLALQQQAPLDLRVNTLRCKPAAAIAALAKEQMTFEPTPWSPIGLRHPDPLPVERSRCFAQGWVEVQDEGSQLVAPLLEPRRGETIVDLCAGAGGKTLQLAALTADQGRLQAFDPSARRLNELKQRAQRAGVTVRATRIEDERAAAVQRLHGKADRVLVDAPCSGTGTLRRNPAIRWQAHDIAALNAVQDRLLDAAAKLLRPGGRLVYATCSLLSAENEQRRADFLQRHPGFNPVAPAPILKRRKIGLSVPENSSELRLYPHRHGCDGFYAAVFEKAGR